MSYILSRNLIIKLEIVITVDIIPESRITFEFHFGDIKNSYFMMFICIKNERVKLIVFM